MNSVGVTKINNSRSTYIIPRQQQVVLSGCHKKAGSSSSQTSYAIAVDTRHRHERPQLLCPAATSADENRRYTYESAVRHRKMCFCCWCSRHQHWVRNYPAGRRRRIRQSQVSDTARSADFYGYFQVLMPRTVSVRFWNISNGDCAQLFQTVIDTNQRMLRQPPYTHRAVFLVYRVTLWLQLCQPAYIQPAPLLRDRPGPVPPLPSRHTRGQATTQVLPALASQRSCITWISCFIAADSAILR